MSSSPSCAKPIAVGHDSSRSSTALGSPEGHSEISVSGANEGVGSRRGWIVVNDETREGQHESSIVGRGIYLIRLPCIRGVVRGRLRLGPE